MPDIVIEQKIGVIEAATAALLNSTGFNEANHYVVSQNGKDPIMLVDNYEKGDCCSKPWCARQLCPAGSRPFTYINSDWEMKREVTGCDNCCCARSECTFLGCHWWRPEATLKIGDARYKIKQPFTFCFNTWNVADSGNFARPLAVTDTKLSCITNSFCFKDCITATFEVTQGEQHVATITRETSIVNWLMTNVNVAGRNLSGVTSQNDKFQVNLVNKKAPQDLRDKLAAVTIMIDHRMFERARRTTDRKNKKTPPRMRMSR